MAYTIDHLHRHSCLLQGIPLHHSPPIIAAFAITLSAAGLLITWAGTACNNPIFAGGLLAGG
jgi:hypothetical protein